MGLDIKLGKLFGILGNKTTENSEGIDLSEVRKKAEELGVSPIEYVAMMGGGSIYNIQQGGDEGVDYASAELSLDEYNLDAVLAENILGNTTNKYAMKDVRKLQSFGLDKPYETYIKQLGQGEASNSQTANNADEQYEKALGNVDETKKNAQKNNNAAEGSLHQTEQRVVLENAAASNALKQVEKNGNDRIVKATNKLKTTKQTAAENNAAAAHEVEEAKVRYTRNVASAETALTNAESERDTNNQNAEKSVTDAENNKSATAKTVTDFNTQITAVSAKIGTLENLLQPTQEQQAELADLLAQKQKLEQQLSTAQKDDEEAAQKLSEAKDNQQKVKETGDTLVNDRKTELESIKQIEQRNVDDAEKNAKRVEEQGERAVSDAEKFLEDETNAVNKMVSTQRESLANTQQQGELKILEANRNVQTTKNKGKEAVDKAEEQAEEAKNHIPVTRDELKSYGAVEDLSSKQVTDNGGNRAKNTAIKIANEKNPEIDEKELIEAARKELADMMRIKDAANFDVVQKCFREPPAKEILAKAASDRFDLESQQAHLTRVDGNKEELLPDGDMNNNLHLQGSAGKNLVQPAITSFASTDEGAMMLQSHIRRDADSGVTSVHLQEAENNGNGASGSGVYTFTDKDILEGSKRFGTDEGDVIAYLLATEKYLQQNPAANQTDNGIVQADDTTNYRMYEILTGTKAEYTDNSGYVNIGVNRFAVGKDANGQEFNDKYSYNALCKAVQKGHTAGNLDVSSLNGTSHSLSIVGVSENGTLLIQESSNTGLLNEMFDFSDSNGNKIKPFKKSNSVNGKPTYECSSEAYNRFIKSGTIVRWK